MSHARIATVCEKDRQRAAAAIASVAPGTAEMVEVRLDALWPQPPDADEGAGDLMAVLEVARVPLLATLRPKRQGGFFEGGEEVRIGLLLSAARSGFPYVDLENEHRHMAAVRAPFRQAGVQVVLSDHRFSQAPSSDQGLRHLLSMQDLDSRFDKVAFPCGSFMDELRALELAHAHAHRRGRPAIAPLGASAALRALLALAGNHATYGAAGAGAPGQPPLVQIQETWDHWGITPADLPGDPDAGWLAVVGDPVDHSLSPRIHNAMLRHAGSGRRYGALRVPDSIGAMRLLATVAPRIGLRGLSVTAPLKRHAAAVTAPDATAQAVGAANCVRFDPDGPRSTNTDATAMKRLLEGAGSVAVLGAGGAAAAALWAARELGVPASFASRDAQRAEPLTKWARWVPWEERHNLRAEAWVQATPVVSPTPVQPSALEGATLAIELVYSHGATSFAAAAAQAGARTTSGRQFLVEQAVDSYRFWTGRPAERQAMEDALP